MPKEKLKTYDVGVREVHVSTYQVKARSPEEAKNKANRSIEAGDEAVSFEYSHTLDTDNWTADEVQI